MGGDEGLWRIGCVSFGRYFGGFGGRGIRTANMGFSVANLEILAASSLRFSGGNMLSNQAEPLFRTPVAVPWRAPVMPLMASAMVGLVLEWGLGIRMLCGWR